MKHGRLGRKREGQNRTNNSVLNSSYLDVQVEMLKRHKDKGVWIQETSELETQIGPSLTLGLVKAT